MSDVAGLASHVECGVATALLWDIESRVVAVEAEILFLATRGRLDQLILVVSGVRIVALKAIANRGAVHRSFNLSCVLVSVAAQAQALRRGLDQLYSRDVPVDPNFVTTGAAHGDRRVDRLALGLVFMASSAGGGIG